MPSLDHQQLPFAGLTAALKAAGEAILLIGATQGWLGQSLYLRDICGREEGAPPPVDLTEERENGDFVRTLILDGSASAAHDLSDGGLAVAVAESCFAGTDVLGAQHAAPQLGAIVEIEGDGPAEFNLFGERGARTIVSVSQGNVAAVLATARQYEVGAREIGKVTRDNTLRIQSMGRAMIASAVATMQDSWAHSLERNLKLP